MPYSIDIRPVALEFIKQQAPKHRKQISNKIDTLRDDPRPPKSEKLIGTDKLRKLRSGNFRIIYTVEDEKLVVVVVTVGDRKKHLQVAKETRP